jgi:hypothetical protein
VIYECQPEEIAMAASILSQDIVSICLLMVKGNTNTRLGDVILEVEEFQKAKNRHFGISTNDFRMLFWWLMFFEIGIDDDLSDPSWLQKFKLHDVIPKILELHYGDFNDEGEGWGRPGPDGSYYKFTMWELAGWFGYTEEEYIHKLAQKQAMKEFFAHKAFHNSKEVMNFLTSQGINEKLLFHCSRPGESS